MFKQLPAAYFISLCFCGSGAILAIDKPAPAQPPKAAGGEAQAGVAVQAAAAILALGPNPGTRQISSIVFKAVRSAPENVLLIVHAAASVSPKAAVPEIVTAATAAVPNPWKQVTYRRLAKFHAKPSEPDFKGGPDGTRTINLSGREPDYKGGPGGRETQAPAADGNPITLAEAITQTAFDAQSGLSLSTLTAAADIALRTDPATLLHNIQSPNSVSGVGDAGLSNYANEPLRTPKQPVVSR